MQRFINFFYSGTLSDNDVVRFIFKQAKCLYSLLGCNLNFIMNRICLQACELEKYNAKTLCEAVFSRWFLQCSDEDVRTACQIEELIFTCEIPMILLFLLTTNVKTFYATYARLNKSVI